MATWTNGAAWSPGASPPPGERHDLIQRISTARLTTRRAGGRLVRRPRAAQARARGADLGFVTVTGQGTQDEIVAGGAG